MKKRVTILGTMLLFAATSGFAAEKSKILAQLDASRAAAEALTGKIGENREAAAVLEQARISLKKASDIYEKGRSILGFGNLKPEAEEEISKYLEISDTIVATATSLLEKARASSELEIIDKQLASVKTKLKVFEDRKAELEKLKADVAKCQTASKEMEILKAENSTLSGQIQKQLAEIKTLKAKLQETITETVKPAKPEKKEPEPVALPIPAKESPAAKEQATVKEIPAEK